MARKKIDRSQHLDADPTPPIALTRVEERIEYVALTDAEKCERLDAAAGIESEISAREMELAGLAEQVKDVKVAIEAKTDEFRRAIREAHEGTKGAAYPVVVERHPDHPSEMIVWRPPLGVGSQQILEGELADGKKLEGPATYADRERQGCTLVEARAMTVEELRAAEEADGRAQNPELPFPKATAEIETDAGNAVRMFAGGKGGKAGDVEANKRAMETAAGVPLTGMPLDLDALEQQLADAVKARVEAVNLLDIAAGELSTVKAKHKHKKAAEELVDQRDADLTKADERVETIEHAIAAAKANGAAKKPSTGDLSDFGGAEE